MQIHIVQLEDSYSILIVHGVLVTLKLMILVIGVNDFIHLFISVLILTSDQAPSNYQQSMNYQDPYHQQLNLNMKILIFL